MSPLILVTNDDGITSSGLHALAAALTELGTVVVIAPDKNWSISGHQKTLNRHLRADAYDEFPVEGIRAYASSGAPADCVALGVMGLLDRRPDIVVSGVNKGPNLGQDITYSGTVAAAFEATILGVPAIAVSLDSRDPNAAFDDAGHAGALVAAHVLREGLPRHSLLNVNVPAIPRAAWQGIAVTRLGIRHFQDELITQHDPLGRPLYWVLGTPPGGDTETPDTDIWATHNGYVSVTPVRLDMTDEALMSRVQAWSMEHGA